MLGNRCLLGMFLTGAWPLLAEIQPLADLPRLTPSMATTMLPSSFAVTACIIGHMDITRRANAAYTAPFRDKHDPILSVRRDRASVNISAAFEQKSVHLGIRSEISNPYKPW